MSEKHWLCDDCRSAAVNGDLTSLDYYLEPEAAAERADAIEAGLERLGWICPDDGDDAEQEHALDACDCCGDRAHGRRWRFVSC